MTLSLLRKPRDAGEYLRAELLAGEIMADVPPVWKEFLALVTQAVEAKARADVSGLPSDRKKAAGLWTDLQTVLGFFGRAEAVAAADAAAIANLARNTKGGGS